MNRIIKEETVFVLKNVNDDDVEVSTFVADDEDASDPYFIADVSSAMKFPNFTLAYDVAQKLDVLKCSIPRKVKIVYELMPGA